MFLRNVCPQEELPFLLQLEKIGEALLFGVDVDRESEVWWEHSLC
jgi:hypothetical protein